MSEMSFEQLLEESLVTIHNGISDIDDEYTKNQLKSFNVASL